MGLYPFQVTGAKWLANRRRAYLADVMGLGKTIQAIVAATAADHSRIVVLCPASVIGSWEEEIKFWSDWRRTFRVYSYDKYTRNIAVREEVADFHPTLLICDEGHYLKGLATKRTKAVLAGLAQSTQAVWLLSGTPMPNGVHELWTPVRYLRPDLLREHGITSYRDWLNTFAYWRQGDYGPQVFGAKNVPLLRKLLFESGFMLRRTFDMVELELPKLNLQRMPLKGVISDELAMMLDVMEASAALEYGELPPQSEHTATTRRLLGAHKAKLVAPIVTDQLLDNPHVKIVVFAYHREVLDYLEDAWQQYGVLRIDGSVPAAERTRRVSTFQKEETHQVFLSQITAGGVGITLTAAQDVIIVEPSWTPEENSQAIARIRRIGQKADTVTARVAYLAGTLDDPITGINIRKTLMTTATLDGTGEQNASNF